MKRLMYCTALSCLLLVITWGCNNSSNTTTKGQNISVDSVKLEQIAGGMEGYWITQAHLEAVERTKSIYANKDLTTMFYGFVFDKYNLMDTQPYLNGFTRSRGGYTAYLKFNPTRNQFDNAPGTDDMEFNLIDDQHLQIHLPNLNRTDAYRKVVDHFTENRRLLSEGKYVDQLSKIEIEFKADGQVIGMGDKLYHEFVIDFSRGPFFDAMNFASSAKLNDKTVYHFKIEGDTLKLFNVKGEGQQQVIGDLVYELVKQK